MKMKLNLINFLRFAAARPFNLPTMLLLLHSQCFFFYSRTFMSFHTEMNFSLAHSLNCFLLPHSKWNFMMFEWASNTNDEEKLLVGEQFLYRWMNMEVPKSLPQFSHFPFSVPLFYVVHSPPHTIHRKRWIISSAHFIYSFRSEIFKHIKKFFNLQNNAHTQVEQESAYERSHWSPSPFFLWLSESI